MCNGRNILGVMDRFKTKLSSTLSQVFKIIFRSLVVDIFGIVWVLGGLLDGRVQITKWGELPMGRSSLLVGLR